MIFDDTLNEIVDVLSKKHRVPAEQIKFAVDDLLKQMKKAIQLPSMPKIMIHRFGTFGPNVSKLYKRIKITGGMVKSDRITKENYDTRTTPLRKVIKRLIFEKPHTKQNKFIISRDYPDGKTTSE